MAGCVPQRPPQIASLEVGDIASVGTDVVYATEGSCQELLRARGAVFEPSESFHTGRGCGIDEPVIFRTGAAELGPDAELECEMALKWLQFDQEVVQPLAQEVFAQPVSYVHQLSDYACRVSTGNRAKLSQHSHGLALDVAAFEMPDGQTISVENDFYASNKQGEFLRRLAERACGYFDTVLTPNSDRYHYNHFHLDLGSGGICSL
ncbi:MAG: extensin family protein [Alphaproteobacteria bacterium]